MADELRRLNWGETPWDNLAREELLREVQRFYAAAVAARSALKLASMNDPQSPFWTSIQGTGGSALTKTSLALGRSEAAKCDDEDVYRCFFRYAADLLFTPEIGFGWWICDKCGTMLGSNPEGVQSNRTCIEPKCKKSPLRPIVWSDLARKDASQ